MGRISRRGLLSLGAAGLVGIVGCVSDGNGTTVAAETETPTETPDPNKSAEGGSPFLPAEYCQPRDAETPSDPLTVQRNLRTALRCRGWPVADFEGDSEWHAWGGEATVQRGAAATGGRSLRVTAGADDVRCGVVLDFPGGIDLSGFNLSVAARIEDPITDGIIVQVLAPDRHHYLQSTRYGYRAGWIRLDHGPRLTRGDPDLTDVRAIRIGTYVGKGKTAELHFDAVRATPRRERGLVVFTFDDNAISQYETAFPILREHGYPGVVGVIPRTVDWSTKAGLAELEEMQSAGWEVVSHPQHDQSLAQLPPEEAKTAIVETKRWLVENGFEDGAEFLIWPFGAYDRESLETAARYHELGFVTSQGATGRVTDPLIVPRVNGEDVDFTKRMVRLSERFGLLCVLEYHGIGPDKATESDLRSVVETVEAADVDVVTLSDLRDRVVG